ncbi:MAG: DUF2304 domain-containing protein [Lachnospiraceae bacterium]|nr:DUF2304 domain-containing protein [Lachnospiraceae bacterium]
MNFRLQIIVAIVIVIGMVYIVNKIRKKQVALKYSLTWFAVGIVYLLFDLIPQLQTWICGIVGISVPQNMLIFLALGLILVISFGQTSIISKQSINIKRLVQETGILKAEIERLKNSEEK